VFNGVPGSGKSSLVFDSLATDSQRLINETYSAFLQGFMPTVGRPFGPTAARDGAILTA
jgi:excinuclease UvrABC ATPase subunit